MYQPESNLEKKALKLAQKYHANQFRKSGEPYVSHCIETARILTTWGVVDPTILASALAHDLLEDTSLSKKELVTELGIEVSKLVDGVTKFKKTTGEGDTVKTKRKIASESFLDPRVAILKLADRLHNMSTLSFVSPEKQILKSRETLLLYAPLAESLGMWEVKRELEDLSFSYLEPVLYQKTKNEIFSDKRLATRFLNHYTRAIQKALRKNKLKVQIEIRKNGIWTLQKKRDKAAFSHATSREDFSKINDLVSIRILTHKKQECYTALSIIHELFAPVVNESRFDEFIVSPRMNGYSALQTTLELPEGSLEIACATVEMERFNNWGVVTVLREGNGRLASYTRKAIFTLNDRVWYLPKEATALDVAYHINAALGRSVRFAIINGKKMPLTAEVPNAATVVFKVGSESVYSTHDALHMVKLSKSKEIIAEEIAQREWESVATKGRRLITKHLIKQKRGIFELSQIERSSLLELFFANGCKSLSEFYYRVGIGNVFLFMVDEYLNSIGFLQNNSIQRGILIRGTKGNDKPGILAEVTGLIARERGNILYIQNIHTLKEHFQTTLLVSGLTPEKAASLKTKFEEDPRFEKVIFV